MLAKLAGEEHKPNDQTVVLPQDSSAFVGRLSARRLPGIGWSTSRQLQAMVCPFRVRHLTSDTSPS